MAEKKNKLGLYVHIPFCVKKCAYCDFLSMPATLATQKAYVDALINEIESYEELAEEYNVETIYFGGGTPSVLEPFYVDKILASIKKVFRCDMCNIKEVTIEVNPGTIGREKWQAYKLMGINRISIGLQSVHNQELKLLGRIHTYEQFLENFTAAREAGFENISVDLMSALPGQTSEQYRKSLETVAGLSPEHISSYSLIVEEGTPFWKLYGEDGPKREALPSEEEDRDMYHSTRKILEAHGYRRYEISNYAKEGYEAVHNSSYWTGTSYIGFGLGASSYVKDRRFSNTRDMQKYLKCSHIPSERVMDVEQLQVEDKMSEFMFLGLRRMCGISKKEFERRFQKDIQEVYGENIERLTKQNLLQAEGDRIYLTEYGIDVSNYVFSEFV